MYVFLIKININSYDYLEFWNLFEKFKEGIYFNLNFIIIIKGQIKIVNEYYKNYYYYLIINFNFYALFM